MAVHHLGVVVVVPAGHHRCYRPLRSRPAVPGVPECQAEVVALLGLVADLPPRHAVVRGKGLDDRGHVGLEARNIGPVDVLWPGEPGRPKRAIGVAERHAGGGERVNG